MESNNYYKILGLNKSDNPTKVAIKKAYRKAALKWHPDKWTSKSDSEKTTAENKFKQVAEAYEILSNPTKKNLYDQYGENGLKSGGNPMNGYNNMGNFQNGNNVYMFNSTTNRNNTFGDFTDPHTLFESFFNDFNTNQNSNNYRNNRNNIKRVNLYCSLEELYNGTTKKMKITHNTNEEIITINIKPGWKEGTKLTFNVNFGKVIFIIKEKTHKYFKRNNNDLIWICNLTKKQSEKGVLLTIPLLDKTEVKFSTKNDMIYNGKRKVLKEKGMPIKHTKTNGDLIIDFIIKN